MASLRIGQLPTCIMDAGRDGTRAVFCAFSGIGGPISAASRYPGEQRDRQASMMLVVEQTLSAIPVVQAFGREKQEHARLRAHASDTAYAYLRAIRADMRFTVLVGLVTAAGTASIMWVGAEDVLRGRLTIGAVHFLLPSYLGSLHGPLSTTTYMASTMKSVAASHGMSQKESQMCRH